MKVRVISTEILIGVSIHGASSMVGNENGFVTFLKKDVPNVVGVHCITRRESLA